MGEDVLGFFCFLALCADSNFSFPLSIFEVPICSRNGVGFLLVCEQFNSYRCF